MDAEQRAGGVPALAMAVPPGWKDKRVLRDSPAAGALFRAAERARR